MQFLKLFLFSILFSSCSFEQGNSNNAGNIDLLDEKAVILKKSDYKGSRHPYEDLKDWTPKNEDLEIVRIALTKAINKNEFYFIKNANYSSLISGFYRQYFPFIDNNGNQIIAINAFCEILEEPSYEDPKNPKLVPWDWKNEYISMEDGGSCYWRVKINISDTSYFNLMIN